MSVNWKYQNKKRRLNVDEEETAVIDIGDLLQKSFENVSSDISIGSQGKIKRTDNHIYFYADVDQSNILQLNLLLKELEKDILSYSNKYNSEPAKIYLHINSPGGELYSAFSAVDTIINLKVKVVSIIEGFAASAATIISVVASERVIQKHAYMLIHQLSSGFWGKYQEFEDEAKNLDRLMKMIKNIYKEYTQIKMTGKNGLNECLKHDLLWDCNECVKHGLVDTIE